MIIYSTDRGLAINLAQYHVGSQINLFNQFRLYTDCCCCTDYGSDCILTVAVVLTMGQTVYLMLLLYCYGSDCSKTMVPLTSSIVPLNLEKHSL